MGYLLSGISSPLDQDVTINASGTPGESVLSAEEQAELDQRD